MMITQKILGVNVHDITEPQAIELVSEWLRADQKKHITTPNIEFIMAAREDREFKKILNEADLAIPDSARFGWAIQELQEKNWLKKLLRWPFYFLPKSTMVLQFPVVTGTDFMNALLEQSAKNNWSVGFLGGRDGVAEKLKEKLKKKHPHLNITYAEPGGVVDAEGEVLWLEEGGARAEKAGKIELPKTDILFVAFGHGKQEKWIYKNLKHQPVNIMIGVGGAFDYLSGMTKRAPETWRKNGFEWLYRLIQQPWRAKRFLAIIAFIFLILFAKEKN